MIVTSSRQEIDASLLRKRKKLSPQGHRDSGKNTLCSPIPAAYLLALGLFLILLGTELPYRDFFPSRALSRVKMPGEQVLEQVEIKTLRAEASAALPRVEEQEIRIRMWELPYERYRMKEGERLSSVSLRYGRSLSTLMSFNGLETISRVGEGDLLLIPSLDGILYKTAKEDSLDAILFSYGLSRSELILFNPHILGDSGTVEILSGQELFIPGGTLSEDEMRARTGQQYIFPVQGRILTPYGSMRDNVTQIESFHNGIDIRGELGDPVAAALDGTVISAGFNNSYGNFIVIDHRNGYKSLYAHLNSISVRRNDKVLQGEIIGGLGKSGFAPRAHLHFSLFKGKKSVDPLDFLH